MSKTKISEYSATAADNTDLGGINCAEGMAPSDVNNWMREMMSQLKEFLDGSSGDTITSTKIVATTAEISALTLSGTATFNSSVVMGSTTNLQDNSLQRPTLLDYCIKGSALGNVGTLATVDMTTANFFSATATAACTWAFTNPCTTGNFGGFIMEITNGGAYTQTWPTSVDWPAGTAPTLTSSGVDLLVFITRDAGTTYHGIVSSSDSK